MNQSSLVILSQLRDVSLYVYRLFTDVIVYKYLRGGRVFDLVPFKSQVTIIDL